MRASLQDRFWTKVNKNGRIVRPDLGPCWEWMAATRPDGYGVIGLGGRGDGIGRAHVLSWEWANGREVPPGLFVLHACDNRPCVNPAHLSVGTPRANHEDMCAKKRNVNPPRHVGASNPRARLLEYKGTARILGEWADVTGIKRETIANRINRGWPIGRALGLEP